MAELTEAEAQILKELRSTLPKNYASMLERLEACGLTYQQAQKKLAELIKQVAFEIIS